MARVPSVRQARFDLARALFAAGDHTSGHQQLDLCAAEPGSSPTDVGILSVRATAFEQTDPIRTIECLLDIAALHGGTLDARRVVSLVASGTGEVLHFRLPTRLLGKATAVRDGSFDRDVLAAAIALSAEDSSRALSILEAAAPPSGPLSVPAQGLRIRALLSASRAADASALADEAVRYGNCPKLRPLAARCALEAGDLQLARRHARSAGRSADARIARALLASARGDRAAAIDKLGPLSATSNFDLLLTGVVVRLAGPSRPLSYPLPSSALTSADGADEQLSADLADVETCRTLATWALDQRPSSLNAAVIRAQVGLEGPALLEGRRFLSNVASELQLRDAPLRWLRIQQVIRGDQDRFQFVLLEVAAADGTLTPELVDGVRRISTTYEQDRAIDIYRTLVKAKAEPRPNADPTRRSAQMIEVAWMLRDAASDQEKRSLLDSAPATCVDADMRSLLDSTRLVSERALEAAHLAVSLHRSPEATLVLAEFATRISYETSTSSVVSGRAFLPSLVAAIDSLAEVLATWHGEMDPQQAFEQLLSSAWRFVQLVEHRRSSEAAAAARLGYLMACAMPSSSFVLHAVAVIEQDHLNVNRGTVELGEASLTIDPDNRSLSEALAYAQYNTDSATDIRDLGGEFEERLDWWEPALQLHEALHTGSDAAVASALTEFNSHTYEQPLLSWVAIDRIIAEARIERLPAVGGEATRFAELFATQQPDSYASAALLAMMSAEWSVAETYLAQARGLGAPPSCELDVIEETLRYCKSGAKDRDHLARLWLGDVVTPQGVPYTVRSELPILFAACELDPFDDEEASRFEQEYVALTSAHNTLTELAIVAPELIDWHVAWTHRGDDDLQSQIDRLDDLVAAAGNVELADRLLSIVWPRLRDTMIDRSLSPLLAGPPPAPTAALPLPPDAGAFTPATRLLLALFRGVPASTASLDSSAGWDHAAAAVVERILSQSNGLSQQWAWLSWLSERASTLGPQGDALNAEVASRVATLFSGDVSTDLFGEVPLPRNPRSISIGTAFVPDDTGPDSKLFKVDLPEMKSRVSRRFGLPEFGILVRGDRRFVRSLQFLLDEGLVGMVDDPCAGVDIDDPTIIAAAASPGAPLDAADLMPLVEEFVLENVERFIDIYGVPDSMALAGCSHFLESDRREEIVVEWLRTLRARTADAPGETFADNSRWVTDHLGLASDADEVR